MPKTAEKRGADRHRVVLGAQILIGEGIDPAPVRIANISAQGARIILGPDRLLPSNFRVKMVRDGRIHTARLVWKNGLNAGIAFAM